MNRFLSSILTLAASFLFGAAVLFGVYWSLPHLPSRALPDLKKVLRQPSVADIRLIQTALNIYIQNHFAQSVVLFSGTYLLLQAFAIPGPVLLSVLAGALFGRTKGLVIVTLCTVFGSALCRMNFQGIGKPVFDSLRGVDKFREEIRKSGDNLFWFFLFLRITPLLPNWFINMSSGNLGIPWSVFLGGTALGLLPNNFIMVGVGAEINEIQTSNEVLGFSSERFVSLLGLGLVALLPVVGRKVLARKLHPE